MIHVTAAIISKAVLGSDIKSEQADQVGDALLTCAEYFLRKPVEIDDLVHAKKIVGFG